MIRKLRIFESTGFDPYVNLATEKHLMDTTAEDTCVLYLWQNQNTVVIGRNQNPWAECRTSLLEQESGKLARRLSGGGAVFHDLGNLNFTFLMRKENYDLDKQLAVIQKACALAGITAEKSGRNDLLADGRKFSGNAFYQSRTHAYHHGTLMVDVDKEKLGRYLSPPKAKLEAKGVASVRSRVVNLKELAPDLTIGALKGYMAEAFCQIYGLQAEAITLTEADLTAINALSREYGSWEYLFGNPLPFTFEAQGHYPWGHIQIQLNAKSGIITDAKVYSDAMDWSLPETLQEVLIGCRFDTDSILAALAQAPLAAETVLDLQDFFRGQTL